MTIADRYAALLAEISAVAREAGRDPSEIRILAVSKGQPAAAIREAVAAGIQDVGENYVQEARKKFEQCHGQKHFIGHVQTNKAKAIVATFDVVQSVDRIEAAAALAREAGLQGKVLPVLLQLNISARERSGIAPSAAEDFAAEVRCLPSLRLDGIMAIGPIEDDRRAIVDAFERAAEVFRLVGGRTLSLGMSQDWPEAVRAGATMIRIGTALFGPRPAPRLSKASGP